MEQYLSLVERILKDGIWKEERTGVGTLIINGAHLEHEAKNGFPLLTTKKMAQKTMKVELEGFIKAKTDKHWYQERNCNVWNDWARRDKIPYSHNEESKKRMFNENDLGPIYGFQWRHWGAKYIDYQTDYSGKGIDQLRNAIEILRKDPSCRKQVISAWNPNDIPKMANDPCHYAFHIDISDGKLNIYWNQRSCDLLVGIPFNFASYALLGHLISLELGIPQGKIYGHLDEVQIYKTHIEGAKEQLKRTPKKLPNIITNNFKSIDDWTYKDTVVLDYEHHPKIEFPIAV